MLTVGVRRLQTEPDPHDTLNAWWTLAVTAILITQSPVSDNSLRRSTISSGFTRLWIIVHQWSSKTNGGMNFQTHRSWIGSSRVTIVAYKRSWRDIFVEHFEFFTKKEKRIKKERKQRPMETAAAMEIGEGGLRRLFLDDFHRCLEKPAQKTLQLFHSYHRPGGD